MVLNTLAQAIGTWKAYPALQNSSYHVWVGNKVYSLSDGNLFSYNTDDDEVYVFDRINGLNDNHIKLIRYCKQTQKLVAIYENGNIDLIYPDNEVSNLKQIKDKNYANLTINNLSIKGKTAYICTNFGIISLDTEKEIFINTYNLDNNVKSCTADDEYIYYSSVNGTYRGKLSDNLLDKSKWEKMLSSFFVELGYFDGNLIGLHIMLGLYSINTETCRIAELNNISYTFYWADDDILLLGDKSKVIVKHSLTDDETIACANSYQHLTYHKGIFWASQELHGIQPLQLSAEKVLKPSGEAIRPNSPIRDYFCFTTYEGNRLLVAGGDLNYSFIERKGTVMYYEEGTWYNFSEEGITEQTQLKYIDVTSIAQDPDDPTHHFVSSSRQGLYEFKDLKFVKKYDHTSSTLDYIRVPESETDPMNFINCMGLKYDDQKNLWMANGQVDTVIVVRKADGEWRRLYYPELKGAPTLGNIMFDTKGRLWLNSKRLSTWGGIFFLDHNGTIDNTKDDIHYLRKGITNQDGITYTPNYYACMVQDHDGKIWIGTDYGPFVIDNPDEFTESGFTYTQIKIARNDGTEYADYLLNGVSVSCMAIDAANRKWIGTFSNGIYLVSADGQEMIQHFTTENSPLISNDIESIAIHPVTGEVMIGTFNELMSYRSDASTPAAALDKDHVKVYPNPVRPDYNGLITIDGLTMNAEVKITTVTGQTVYSGHANGGMFTWNGRNQAGKRVSSGVYNIISTNAEGKKAIVNRITFIY